MNHWYLLEYRKWINLRMHVSERLAKALSEGTMPNSSSTSKKSEITRSSPREKLSLEREQAETEGLIRRLEEMSRQLPSLEKALTLFKDPTTTKGYCAQELETVMKCYEQNPKKTLYCHDYVQELQQCVKRVRESVLAS